MTSKSVLILPGLNQLYYVNKCLNYFDLEKKIRNYFSKFEIYFKTSQNENFTDYKNEISKNLEEEKFNKVLSEFIDSNVTFVNEKHYKLIDSNKFNIYVHNKNLFYLFIDKIILHNVDFLSKLNFYSEKEILTFLSKNKIIYLDYDPDNIIKFEKEFNCFTVLLNCYSFCHLDKENETEEYKIQNKIINIFQEFHNLNILYKNSPYIINKGINFISNNFYQLYYYYNLAIDSQNYENLCNSLNKIQPKVILLFTRTLTRKQEFLKQKNYISSKEILYKPHYGGENIEYNGKFNCILTKAVETKDLSLYNNIFEKLSNFKNANDPKKFPYFIDKNKQSEFLKNFINFPEVKILCEKYKINLEYPNNIQIEGNELLNKEKLINKLKENNISFPIIIKYTSKLSLFKHLISIIFNEENFEESIKEISKGENSINAKCIIQTIINHGGYVLKVYHYGKENYIDYRSSLPDININFQKEFNKGFWIFKTIELESLEYKNNIWNKYVIPSFISDKIDSNDKKNFVYQLCDLFSKFSDFNFYGVDLLFDYVNNKFYIVDVNALPSYKIPNFKPDIEFQNFFKSFN